MEEINFDVVRRSGERSPMNYHMHKFEGTAWTRWRRVEKDRRLSFSGTTHRFVLHRPVILASAPNMEMDKELGHAIVIFLVVQRIVLRGDVDETQSRKRRR